MSWIRSSRGVLLAVLLAVGLTVAGTATAIEITGDAPDPGAVGESVSMETTIKYPFDGPPDQWTLQGSTDLDNATWTVEVLSQGDPVDTTDASGETFSYDLNSQTGATDVIVTVQGTVPSLDTFNYDDMAVENYSAMTLSRATDGTTTEMESFAVHRYTEASDEARTAIDQAIEAVGSRTQKIEQAVSSYDNANFENAKSLADEAESGAGGLPIVLIGGAVVVILALVGGVYYWRQQQSSTHKLQ